LCLRRDPQVAKRLNVGRPAQRRRGTKNVPPRYEGKPSGLTSGPFSFWPPFLLRELKRQAPLRYGHRTYGVTPR